MAVRVTMPGEGTVRVAHIATIDLTLHALLLPQLASLRDEGYEVTGISAPGPWVARLEAEGIRHVAWPSVTRSWNLAADARALRELRDILSRDRFDLVHTHTPKGGVLGRVAARRAGVPNVVNTVHGYYATREDPLRRRLPVMAAERVSARYSDLELFQSEEDLRWARHLGLLRPGQGAYLGNGTDLVRFAAENVSAERAVELRSELGIPADAVVVGAVGRLVREKGYLELFRAARMLRRSMPELRFLVVGEDPGTDDLIRAQDLRAASDGITFAGWRADVRDLLGVMDVFVLPSKREGMPRSAIEAAAMSLPLVLSDIRGCREVCRDGREGILVPPGNPDRLAAAIARLAGDPVLRKEMGLAARQRVEERFDEQRVFERLVMSYERLVGRPAQVRRGAFRLRAARPEDARALARLHGSALPGAFLSSLGEGFLKRLYRAIASDPEAVCVVATESGRVAGFVSGTPSVSRFYRRFYRRHGVQAAVAAAPRLVRPSVLKRARETAAHPSSTNGLPEAELLSIGVVPSARGRGVAGALMQELRRQLGARGVREAKVVVGADNVAANRLYDRAGFTPAGKISVHDGVTSNVWTFACPS